MAPGDETVMSEQETEHREREHRQRVLKGATIITSIHTSEIPCVIRNQHANGAELKVAADVVVLGEALEREQLRRHAEHVLDRVERMQPLGRAPMVETALDLP